MLVEPDLDAARLALDDALAAALTARIAARVMAPDAEAIALRNRVRAAQGRREAEALKALWGRLNAASWPRLVVTPEAAILAADRFGTDFEIIPDGEAALKAAETGRPALINLGRRAWWGRLLARPMMRVIAALPDDPYGSPRALLVSTEVSGPTGDDRSFWVTDTSQNVGVIEQALAAQHLTGRMIAHGGGLKLFSLAGYVQAEDGRLAGLPGDLAGVIGAAPIY